MPNFGPFETASEAILAACPLILSQPHAVAGRRTDPNFGLYLRVSTEYCAWLYYTLDNKFEMSMLGTVATQDAPDGRRCVIPAQVNDPRYPAGSIKYVYVLHSHPYEGELSRRDIEAIVAMGRRHGFKARIADRDIYLGIIAFFPAGSFGDTRCGGFFEYIPVTAKIFKWATNSGRWEKREYAEVKWTNAVDFEVRRK